MIRSFLCSLYIVNGEIIKEYIPMIDTVNVHLEEIEDDSFKLSFSSSINPSSQYNYDYCSEKNIFLVFHNDVYSKIFLNTNCLKIDVFNQSQNSAFNENETTLICSVIPKENLELDDIEFMKKIEKISN